MKYSTILEIYVIILLFTISFSSFFQIPSNITYKLYVTPPATCIKEINIDKSYMNISIDSTIVSEKYTGINSIIIFLNKKFKVEKRKVLLKLESNKKINFMGNLINKGQFLVETGWKYCSYKNILYIFQVRKDISIRIPIPKYKLQISSMPKSKVFIKNIFMGTTPLSTKLYYDNYTLKIEPKIAGYETKNISVNLNKDLNLKITLNKLKQVTIDTNIDQFMVMINGKREGRKIYLNSGKYLLTIKATGFYTLNRTITVKNDSENFFFELKPKLFNLSVQSLKKANIYVDNILVGKGKIDLSLNEGRHMIKISLRGFSTVTKEIFLKKNETIIINLSPLSGTIVAYYNIKNALFAYYKDNNLIILTPKNIFEIKKDIGMKKNVGYSYIYNGIYVDSAGKIMLNGKIFTLAPYITGILKLKNYYVISTSAGYIYIFNGESQPLAIKNLSSNFSYLKIESYRKNILALTSNGKIYEINIGKGTKKILISKKFIKDFDIYNEKIYALGNNKVYVYIGNRELKSIYGKYESIYKNIAYGKNILNIDKNKIIGKCDLKSVNSGIYYYESKIYDPENDKEYKTDVIPTKMIKYNDYLVIISKDKVEVMKL